MNRRIAGVLVVGLVLAAWLHAQGSKHTFALGTDDFLLDGKPLQIIAGEIHPARIPAEYWQHRIRMAKAMGTNTIAAYIFCGFCAARTRRGVAVRSGVSRSPWL